MIKIMSVVFHISGTIHMIVIYGTKVQNDDISRRFFHIFKTSFFWVVQGVKW